MCFCLVETNKRIYSIYLFYNNNNAKISKKLKIMYKLSVEPP